MTLAHILRAEAAPAPPLPADSELCQATPAFDGDYRRLKADGLLGRGHDEVRPGVRRLRHRPSDAMAAIPRVMSSQYRNPIGVVTVTEPLAWVCMSVFRHLNKELVTALLVQLGAGHHQFRHHGQTERRVL